MSKKKKEKKYSTAFTTRQREPLAMLIERNIELETEIRRLDSELAEQKQIVKELELEFL